MTAKRTIDPVGLQRRFDVDLASRLPPSVRWQTDVELFLPYDIKITHDEAGYACSVCLMIGINESRYLRTLEYAVEFILDHECMLA